MPRARVGIGVPGREFAETRARPSVSRRRLAIAGYRVVLGVGRHGRPLPIRPSRRECSRHSAAARFDFEPFAAQPIHEPRSGPVFAPCRLREFPDRAMPLGKRAAMLINPTNRELLAGRHAFCHPIS